MTGSDVAIAADLLPYDGNTKHNHLDIE